MQFDYMLQCPPKLDLNGIYNDFTMEDIQFYSSAMLRINLQSFILVMDLFL